MLNQEIYFEFFGGHKYDQYLCSRFNFKNFKHMNSKTNKKVVHIKCNSKVKRFTMKRLQSLGINVGLGHLFEDLVRYNSTTGKDDAKMIKFSKELVKLIPYCRPNTLLTTQENNEVLQFIKKWKEIIVNMMEVHRYVPVYFKDEVNSLLTVRGSSIRCSRVHLEWCLSILGPDEMTPSKIADTIMKYTAEEWQNMKPLVEDTFYSVRLEDDSKDTKEKFHDTIEFIDRLSYQAFNKKRISELENDINILNSLKKWRDEASEGHAESLKKYLKCVNQLQTVSTTILPKKLMKTIKALALPNDKASRVPSIKDTLAKSPATVYESDTVSNMDVNNESEGFPGEDTEAIREEAGGDNHNYKELMDYLTEKVKDDPSGQEKLNYATNTIMEFCQLENFSIRFAQIRSIIDSGSIKFPGGFAVKEMVKMMDPEYEPYIRRQDITTDATV